MTDPRRIRLTKQCWPVLSDAFMAALRVTATGTGQTAFDGTHPGRLVTTLDTITGRSRERTDRDTDVSTTSTAIVEIDRLVRLCLEQNNPSPLVGQLLEPFVKDENHLLLDGLLSSVKNVSADNLDQFIEQVRQLVPAHPLLLLVGATDHRPSENSPDIQVRTHVSMPPPYQVLACSRAQSLIVNQMVDPPALDWDLGGPDEIQLIATTRAVVRRQLQHHVWAWTGPTAKTPCDPGGDLGAEPRPAPRANRQASL